jgi:hypothetical protein
MARSPGLRRNPLRFLVFCLAAPNIVILKPAKYAVVKTTAQNSVQRAERSVDQLINAVFGSPLLHVQIPAPRTQRILRELFEEILLGPNSVVAMMTAEYDCIDRLFPEFAVSSRKISGTFRALGHFVAFYIRSHCEAVTTSVKLKTSTHR